MSHADDLIPLHLCVLTVSDSRTLAEDRSGDYLAEALAREGHHLHARALLPDDRYRLRAQVSQWIADPAADGILVTRTDRAQEVKEVPGRLEKGVARWPKPNPE